MPKRHLFYRFVKDYKQWALPYMDYVHFTQNLSSPTPDGFNFPSEYVGQYGCYDAVRHVYANSSHLKHLLNEKDGSIHISKKNFGIEME